MTLSRNLLVWTYILIVIPLFSQNDSLELLLPSLSNDTSKVKVLQEIAYSYLYSDHEKCIEYIEELKSLSKSLDFGKGERYGNYLLGTVKHFSGKDEEALDIINSTISSCIEANDEENLAKAYNVLVFIYQDKFELNAALEVGQKSLELCKKIGNKTREGTAYHTIASIYSLMYEYDTANEYLKKALNVFEETGDKYRLGVVLQGLATTSSGQESINYAKKGLELLVNTNDFQGQGMCYWSIGDAHAKLQNYELALENYERALQLFIDVDFAEGIAHNQSNVGLMLTYLGKYNEAYPFLVNSSKIIKEADVVDIYKVNYKGFAQYYAGVNQPQKVILYMDSLTTILDSIYSIERSKSLIISENNLKTREKEVQITEQALKIEKQKNTRNIIIISSIFLVLFLIGLVMSIKNKQKREQKEANAALDLERAKAEQLREIDQLKSNFFANISHEFRTPLTLIIGPIDQLIKGSFQGNPNKLFEIIKRNGQRLLSLINQLLELSKLENNKIELQNKSGDFNKFSRQLANSIESWADQKQISYDITIPEGELFLEFDKDIIEKIIINILSNAMKFTDVGGEVKLLIRNEWHSDNCMVNITIEDNGIGISEEAQEHIFERFYQSQTSNYTFGSSGIGLALTKELVNLYEGDIQIQSVEGKGTKCSILLKLKKGKNFEESISAELPINRGLEYTDNVISNSVEAEKDENLPLVLIVEDNKDVREYIKDNISKNYRTLEACQGQEGYDLAMQNIPDLIISDVMMPIMDGVSMTSKIKNDIKTNHIPIILLTAKSEKKDRIGGFEKGADDYLTKPFDSEELNVRIKNLIDQRALLKEKYKENLYYNTSNEKVDSLEEKFLKEVLFHIEANLDNELFSVEDLANQVNFSRGQLHRKLKGICDKGPNKMIREFRLFRAKELLEQKSASISEIAYSVGFSNLSYFSKSFKQQFGKLPGEI